MTGFPAQMQACHPSSSRSGYHIVRIVINTTLNHYLPYSRKHQRPAPTISNRNVYWTPAPFPVHEADRWNQPTEQPRVRALRHKHTIPGSRSHQPRCTVAEHLPSGPVPCLVVSVFQLRFPFVAICILVLQTSSLQ